MRGRTNSSKLGTGPVLEGRRLGHCECEKFITIRKYHHSIYSKHTLMCYGIYLSLE